MAQRLPSNNLAPSSNKSISLNRGDTAKGEMLFLYDGFTIQVQQTNQIEKTHRLSPCKMESPQDQLQGELD
ncbi:hypothetical protein NNA34_10495, partial [Lacticaseibacillus paracasei]|nr:hypothetical protein [Lacticaseibacillus paracasei]